MAVRGTSLHKGGKKNRKHGRNKKGCKRYQMIGRRERNKIRKLTRHLKKYPNDATAKKALRGLSQSRGAFCNGQINLPSSRTGFIQHRRAGHYRAP